MEDNNFIKYDFQNYSFSLKNPETSSYLYFPLANASGMMSSITPNLLGDIKSSQDTFLLNPVSCEDLHNSKINRNFWIYVKGKGAWSATGNSALQASKLFSKDKEETLLECGLLWHKVTRTSKELNIKSEIINFVPVNNDKVELMRVKLTNLGKENIVMTPTAAIPMYGRSAANIRDHHHVTSLLNRIKTTEFGVNLSPSLTFDERGHKKNTITYSILGAQDNGKPPVGFFPDVECFTGEGGSYEWPEAVIKNFPPSNIKNETIDGYEAVGALRFKDVTLNPGESKSYIIVMAISKDNNPEYFSKKYLSDESFKRFLDENKYYWKSEVDKLTFHSSNEEFDTWLKWITVQPILRRIYGCSFLPHHDYGRGGRGWRDLWQDCLALIPMNSIDVRNLLLNNFAGVRIDGSNATIIGNKPGEFIADRNSIARVWMDHGAWPFLTTKFYIDETGDIDFLLEKQSYFKDMLSSRCSEIDEKWTQDQSTKLKTQTSEVYEGSILEHLIVQNLSMFFNVGKHNNIKLEGADWNDAFDMASENGESVAFTALYGSNLIQLGQMLSELKRRNRITQIELISELSLFLNSKNEINYDSPTEKINQLDKYFKSVKHCITGQKIKVDIDTLINDFKCKGEWIFKHIQNNEWIKSKEGFEWFNGYYDNSSHKLEGDFPSGTRMTLTGQVFPLMSSLIPKEKITKVIKSADKYLKDESLGGYRLNSDFKELKLDMGRAFGFAFGHKENGSMFSHMDIMFANSLYKNNFSKEAFSIIKMIFNHCSDFKKSRIYPGIPEYINERGRGMYSYLTGAASWIIITMLTESYGIKGNMGDLIIEPKLLKEQFDKNCEVKIDTIFQNHHLCIIYRNPKKLDFDEYSISLVLLNGSKISDYISNGRIVIPKSVVDKFSTDSTQNIMVELS